MLAWGVFFAVALLALALRYWVLPEIDRYREEIASAMSRAVGLPVRVGAIEAGWPGLRLHLRLADVRIQDAQGREALALPAVENVLSWRALARGRLEFDQLIVESPKLTVRRDAAGELYVAGLKIAPGSDAGGGFGAWLLAQREVRVRNAELEWHDELRQAPPLVLSGVEVRLAGAEGEVSLGVTARTPPELGGAIDLRALARPGGLDPAAPSARLFLQVERVDLAAWRPWIEYRPLDVRRGHGAVRAWATLEKGIVTQATADVALAEVRVSLGDELAPLELAALAGRLRGRALADGVELSGRALAAQLEERAPMPIADFDIAWRPTAGGALGASVVDLESLRLLAGSLPLPPQLAAAVRELAPQGRLTGARLEWSGPYDAPTSFSARTGFSALAVRPRDGFPGVSGLSGSLDASLGKGTVTIASADAALELPEVLPAGGVPLDSLAGELHWSRDAAGGLAVQVSSLSFTNEHLSGNLFGSYSRRDDGPGSLDLSAILSRADASAVERYLPHAHLMGADTRQWLASAIVAGEASDVRLRLRGDLRDFPFADAARGEFSVSARVDNGVLDYAPGWPRIENIAAELHFERDRMEIAGRGGSILGARLADVRVGIPKLARGGTRVLVSGQAEGPSDAFLKFLDATPPLREATEGFTAGMRAAGSGRLRLELELPLADLDRSRVQGEFEFAGNDVALMPGLPPVDDARGRVAFTRSGFKLLGVRGRALGGEVALEGGSQRGRGLDIRARGEAAFEATRALFDHPLGRHLAGRFDYAVWVQAKGGLPRVSVESSLRGLSSALPPPLAKEAAQALPLRIELIPTAKGERDRIAVTLGTLARAEVSRRREGEAMVAQRTAVWLGHEAGQPIRLPERPGVLVYGSLAALDVDRWLALFEGGAESSHTVAIDMKVARLDAFGRRLRNVALRASAEPTGWSANVNADELAGDVSYRAGKEPLLVARLSHFTVPPDSPGPKAPAQPPRDLPSLDLVADEFNFRNKALGRVELVAKRDGADWRVEGASMSNPDATLTGRGVWRAATSRTEVEFDLHAADVGAFLGRVGHPDLVKGGSARLQGALDWYGDPATLDFPSLGGALELQVDEGQFLEIEPGLGKLISLMSLQALPRRVTLDFRDVFSKGFQFDRISSAAQVERGVIRLKEFRMRGSAAEVEMSGEADIARETQDLRVRVVPSLGDTAALGITLVNPVAGVAAAIAQRILKNPLGQIFAFDYAVTGSWTDPKVAKLQAELPAHVGQ